MRHFAGDDVSYLGWIADHTGSFVLSTTRSPSASYLMLHRANCWTITRLQPTATTFTGDYSKVCGERGEPGAYARTAGATVSACGHCR